jgi:flagellar biogenesis protein FliO
MQLSKIFRINFFIITFLLYFTGIVNAIQNEYTNQLLKIGFNKIDNTTVSATIYTTSAYSIRPVPIKRAGNEYVLILPETYHSITSNPDFTASDGLIRNVDVKLLPYISSNSNNGYTKVSFKLAGDNIKMSLNNEIVANKAKITQDDNEIASLLGNKPLVQKQEKNTSKTFKTIYKDPPEEIPVNYKTPKPAKTAQKITAKPVTKIETTEKEPVKPHQADIKQTSPQEKPYIATVKEKTAPQEAKPAVKKTIKKEKTDKEVTVKIAAVENSNAKKPAVITDTEKPVSQTFTQAGLLNNKNFLYTAGISAVLVPLLLMFIMMWAINKFVKKPKKQALNLSQPENETAISINTPDKLPFSPNSNNNFSQHLPDEEENTGGNIYEFKPEYTEYADFEEIPAVNETKDTDYNNYDEFSEAEPEFYVQNDENDADIFYETDDFNETDEENEESDFSFKDVFEQNEPAQKQFEAVEEKEDEEGLNLIESSEIDENKRIYLVELEGKKLLIGEINSEIFVLQEFDNEFENPKIHTRITDHRNNRNIYHVQVEKWRALVGVTEQKMELMLVL